VLLNYTTLIIKLFSFVFHGVFHKLIFIYFAYSVSGGFLTYLKAVLRGMGAIIFLGHIPALIAFYKAKEYNFRIHLKATISTIIVAVVTGLILSIPSIRRFSWKH